LFSSYNVSNMLCIFRFEVSNNELLDRSEKKSDFTKKTKYCNKIRRNPDDGKKTQLWVFVIDGLRVRVRWTESVVGDRRYPEQKPPDSLWRCRGLELMISEYDACFRRAMEKSAVKNNSINQQN